MLLIIKERDSGKKNNSGEILNKIKSLGSIASSLSTINISIAS